LPGCGKQPRNRASTDDDLLRKGLSCAFDAHQGWRDAVTACQVTDEGNLASVADVK
jgi:hypothetical protein